MNVPLLIARRYLFARKSHNVINVISAICAAGMAVGTAALVLILSVYNGFDRLVTANVSDLSPELLITAPDGSRGKFVPDSLLLDDLSRDERVSSVICVLEDNVLLTYDGTQSIARAKGVEDAFGALEQLGSHVYEGSFSLAKGDLPGAIFGSTLARSLGLRPHFVAPVYLHYPDKDAPLSLSNPAASARSVKALPTGLISISTDVDESLVIVPIHVMRTLIGGDEELVSGVEVRLHDGSKQAVRRFKRDYAPRTAMLDRYEQQPALFKMMRYEKAAVFIILILVVLIVALNIYGSLSMLKIEKEEDVQTLHALGASESLTRRIFVYEGSLVSLLGMAVGVVVGLALALLQQEFGLVKLPGNYLVEAYPVHVQPLDVVQTCVAIALIGLVISVLSAGGKSAEEA